MSTPLARKLYVDIDRRWAHDVGMTPTTRTGHPRCRTCHEDQRYDGKDGGGYWRAGAMGPIYVLTADGQCWSCANTEDDLR